MINLWKVREMVDKATNLVMNYTETEAKVREATNDDPWGPSGAQMNEIASFTFTYEQFPEVMGMLWKRMLVVTLTKWRSSTTVIVSILIEQELFRDHSLMTSHKYLAAI